MLHRRFCSKLIGITLGAYAVNVFQSTCDDKVVPVVKKNRFDGMALMAGSTGKQLSSDIANLLGCPTINVTTQRYILQLFCQTVIICTMNIDFLMAKL